MRNLPIWAVAVLMFTVTGGLWFLFGLLITPDQPPIVRLVGTIFYAGVMTVFFTIWIARARKRAGGANELDRIGKAVKSGSVPADADVDMWTATINTQHDQLRRQLWLGPVVFGSAIALSTWLAVTDGWLWWGGVVFFGAVLIWSVVSTPRGLRQVAHVRDELASRPASISRS